MGKYDIVLQEMEVAINGNNVVNSINIINCYSLITK